MEPKLTNVFYRTGDALLKAVAGTGPRLIINQGGQGSSKTYSILQVIYNHLIGAPATKVTLCSYALPHLKQGVISDLDNILTTFNENLGVIKSAPSQPIYSIGKSVVNCYGVEGNLALAHGPRRGILFINEANRKITYEVFDQLFSRSQVTMLDYNPDAEFWLHEKVIPNFPHVLIKSNYLDNPYLPEQELANILMKKGKPGFENWWKVYGLGEMGKLEGSIFPNWRHGKFDESLPFGFGIDFGFSDPDAMVKIAIDLKKMKLYVDECIYANGLSSSELGDRIAKHADASNLIIGDAADARLIYELGRRFNIKPANKKSGSVQEGIKLMQDFEIIVTDDSPNIAKSLNNYVWSDKKGQVPEHAFSHICDAIRYYVSHQLIGRNKKHIKVYN